MFDNFLKHKILEQILQYKTMFYMEKEVFVSLDNFKGFFPKTKRFDEAFINLLSRGNISVKQEDGITKVNLEKEGLFALNNNTFKKEAYSIRWNYIKDGGSLFLSILMAFIAILALYKDESKFADKNDIQKIQQQIVKMKDTLSQMQNAQATSTQIHNPIYHLVK